MPAQSASRNLRVLMVTGSYPPDRCGVGDYTAQLVEHLRDQAIDVIVLTSVAPDRQGDVAAERVMRTWGLDEARLFRNTVKSFAPDIVHLQYPTQGFGEALLPWLIPLLSRLSGSHVVQTWHEPYSRRRMPKLLLKAIAGGGIIVVRPDFRGRLHPMLRWALWRKRYRYIKSASTMPVCKAPDAEIAALRARYLQGRHRLIVFFGFVYPHKGVDTLLDIANPETDRIVIAGEFKSPEYRKVLEARATANGWIGKVDFTGFLANSEASMLLAAADAVVLPFENGGGDWNTSIHAATQQGTFVLTTSTSTSGYDETHNVYYAEPGNTEEMRSALTAHSGRKVPADSKHDAWRRIAAAHAALYQELVS